MPSKPRDPARPTFYLDHSTLCDAFRAHVVGTATPSVPAYRPLFAWITRVAEEANLCLSVFHLAELARWGDRAAADGMARWYESMPVVWVRSLADVQDAEDEHWTMRAAGVMPAEPVWVFAPSILAAFREMSPEAAAQLLSAREPLLKLLEAAREHGQRSLVQAPLQAAQAFREDRACADHHGRSPERKANEVGYKMRVDLRKRAMAADKRLTVAGNATYAAKTCSAGDVQDRVTDLFAAEPKAMPCYRAVQAFNEGFVAFAIGRAGPSKKEAEALRGSFHDLVHLAVGAAYCDTFTCDARVSGWLGDLRQRLGFCRQLTVRESGGPEAFVRALMAAWP